MAAIALLVPVLLVAATVLIIGLVVWLVGRARSDDGGPAARTARRHELVVTGSAVAVAIVAAIGLAAQPVTWPGWAPAPGVLQALTPFAVGTVFALARTLGELTWPRPHGTVRSVPLTRRTPWSIGATRLRWVLATAAALVVTLAAAGLTADPTGRAFASEPVTLPDGSTLSSGAGPFPGWPYGAPMLTALALTLGATWLALAVITRRAPLPHVSSAHDDAVRRTSAARLLAITQVCLGITLGAVLVFAGAAIGNQGQTLHLNGANGTTYVVIGLAVAITGVIVILASGITALLALWSRRVPRPAFDPRIVSAA